MRDDLGVVFTRYGVKIGKYRRSFGEEDKGKMLFWMIRSQIFHKLWKIYGYGKSKASIWETIKNFVFYFCLLIFVFNTASSSIMGNKKRKFAYNCRSAIVSVYPEYMEILHLT